MGTVLSSILLSLAILTVAGLNIASIVYLDRNQTSSAKEFLIWSIIVAIGAFILGLILIIFLF